MLFLARIFSAERDIINEPSGIRFVAKFVEKAKPLKLAIFQRVRGGETVALVWLVFG